MSKYLKVSSVLALLAVCLLGCKKDGSLLDPQSTSELNEATVFANAEYATDFLINIYSYLKFEVGTSGAEPNNYGASLSDWTDESEVRWPGGQNISNQVNSGTFGQQYFDRVTANWTNLYTAIRQVNIYLKNVNSIPISEDMKSRTAAEARFLRAYFYHKLMCYYGGVVLVGDNVQDMTGENTGGRNTYEECVDYIVSELDDIAPAVPLSYSGFEYGRVTRGAALALKARVLLYAASPLFNGNTATDGSTPVLAVLGNDAQLAALVSYPSRDNSRWTKALQASRDVMNLNVYSLHTDNTRPGNGFYDVFLERVNNEAILSVMLGANKGIESNYNPPSRGGQFFRYPTQEMVDAFPMKNGKRITDNTSGYVENRMYENRDPRFYFTIIYNGALYWDQRVSNMTQVLTYVGANLDGLKPGSVNSGTVTGYYIRKMADETMSSSGSGNTFRCPPIFRYAEILLNLAEADVETGNIGEAMNQLIELRKRAGIEAGADQRYGIPSNPTQQEARRLVRDERFIELAFEDLRYWDIRRWGIAAQYDGKYVTGISIVRNANGTYTGTRFNVRSPRYFKVNSYFFPIPVTEAAINRNIKQNPGW